MQCKSCIIKDIELNVLIIKIIFNDVVYFIQSLIYKMSLYFIQSPI